MAFLPPDVGTRGALVHVEQELTRFFIQCLAAAPFRPLEYQPRMIAQLRRHFPYRLVDISRPSHQTDPGDRKLFHPVTDIAEHALGGGCFALPEQMIETLFVICFAQDIAVARHDLLFKCGGQVPDMPGLANPDDRLLLPRGGQQRFTVTIHADAGQRRMAAEPVEGAPGADRLAQCFFGPAAQGLLKRPVGIAIDKGSDLIESRKVAIGGHVAPINDLGGQPVFCPRGNFLRFVPLPKVSGGEGILVNLEVPGIQQSRRQRVRGQLNADRAF